MGTDSLLHHREPPMLKGDDGRRVIPLGLLPSLQQGWEGFPKDGVSHPQAQPSVNPIVPSVVCTLTTATEAITLAPCHFIQEPIPKPSLQANLSVTVDPWGGSFFIILSPTPAATGARHLHPSPSSKVSQCSEETHRVNADPMLYWLYSPSSYPNPTILLASGWQCCPWPCPLLQKQLILNSDPGPL